MSKDKSLHLTPKQLGLADNPMIKGGALDSDAGETEPDFPHTPWFIRPEPTDSGMAVIENGTEEGRCIAVCEWHIAEEIVKAINIFHKAPD